MQKRKEATGFKPVMKKVDEWIELWSYVLTTELTTHSFKIIEGKVLI